MTSENMKKATLILFLTLLTLTIHAQQQATAVRFGFLSYEAVMQSMPDYAIMQENMKQLRQQYEAEQHRSEDEFNKKYEEFLDGQASFPKTILRKRQSELQELLDKNVAFKHESQRLLEAAEADAKAPLASRINAVLVQLGMNRGYAFILNTDQNSALFINPAMGEDITEEVKAALK